MFKISQFTTDDNQDIIKYSINHANSKIDILGRTPKVSLKNTT